MKKINYLVLVFILNIIASCQNTGEQEKENNKVDTQVTSKVKVPQFNADSAYYFVEKQVAFGPRVPNSPAHVQCASFFEEKLKSYTPDVVVQKARVRAYDGTVLNISNFVASFNVKSTSRIFLSAHWDSRPIAEKDEDPALRNKPIDGANDGASGVGVLLEIARVLSQNLPAIGVDIILFDGEDYGQPFDSPLPQKEDSWALGSQYWSKNPHNPGYFAKYGILLDMVGAEDAVFLKEGYSIQFAPDVVEKVWLTAQRLGFNKYFSDKKGGSITDDHYYVNTIIGIPTIDIIHYDNSTGTGFFPYWHTHGDNMDNISKPTLNAVGQTLLQVIFEEK